MVRGLPGRPSPIQLGLRQLSTRVLRGTIRRPALRQAPGGRRAFAPLHTPLLISLLGVVSASLLEVATGKGRSRGCCARAALGTWSARRCITRPPSPALGCSTSLPTLPCRSRAGTRSRPLGNTLFYGVCISPQRPHQQGLRHGQPMSLGPLLLALAIPHSDSCRPSASFGESERRTSRPSLSREG